MAAVLQEFYSLRPSYLLSFSCTVVLSLAIIAPCASMPSGTYVIIKLLLIIIKPNRMGELLEYFV